MIKIETIEIAGFAGAFSALRLPFGKEERSRIEKTFRYGIGHLDGDGRLWESHFSSSVRVDAFSYQALRNIARQRWNHRLPEWHEFVDWVKTLPFSHELILDGLDIKEKED